VHKLSDLLAALRPQRGRGSIERFASAELKGLGKPVHFVGEQVPVSVHRDGDA
jgi:hypothetical protein